MKYLYAGILSAVFATASSAAVKAPTGAALPAPHSQGGITWLTGGVGREEAKAIEREAGAYPLELVFVQKTRGHDQFLADVPVTIRDKHHRVVFEGRTAGPYFLARLPDGDYVVTARWEQWRFSRNVHVGAGHQRVVFEWKKAAAARA